MSNNNKLTKKENCETAITDVNSESEGLQFYIRTGNLNNLSNQEIATVITKMCIHYGLEPMFRPFEIIEFKGKKKLYFSKNGCDQLATKRKLSRKVIRIEVDPQTLMGEAEAEVYDPVTERKETQLACMFFGQYSEVYDPAKKAQVLKVSPLLGEAYANAKMKLYTKALRKATLAFIGDIAKEDPEDLRIRAEIEEEQEENSLPEIKSDIITGIKKEKSLGAGEEEEEGKEEKKTTTKRGRGRGRPPTKKEGTEKKEETKPKIQKKEVKEKIIEAEIEEIEFFDKTNDHHRKTLGNIITQYFNDESWKTDKEGEIFQFAKEKSIEYSNTVAFTELYDVLSFDLDEKFSNDDDKDSSDDSDF